MIQYPTIVLEESDIKLAKQKADELVAFFKPRIVSRQKSGSSIQNLEERMQRLEEDQLTGQLAQLGGTLYLTGGNQMYRLQRWNCMRTPDRGDGGYDIPGLSLDFKGSRLRPSKKPTDYVLAVRDNERKRNWTYGLVVVDRYKEKVFCHIMGWVSDNEMKDRLQKTGQFAGAYVSSNDQLHAFPNFRWEL
tara:strand:- start:23503 stop:24072 length:570 start_codon:yes stop_codon:yes gene_type:complete